MSSFEEAIDDIIQKAGFENCQRIKLMEDASTRSYERLYKDNQTAILMKAPPGNENPPCPKDASVEERLDLGWNATSRLAGSRVEAFVALSNFLSKNGFSTPRIYASNVEEGVAVIEDLGLDLYAEVLKDKDVYKEQSLYKLAGELLAKLHNTEIPAELPAPNGVWPLLEFDALALTVNADLFVSWVPQFLGMAEYSQEVLAEWAQIRSDIIAKILKHPRKLTLRDYHAENMLYLNDREGMAKIGLLDFQDAVIGFRAWDFSMLLHDARRDVSKEAHEAAVKAYVATMRIVEEDLRNEIDLEGSINILRIIGIFARLIERDKKEKYRAFMPRMVGHLETVLKNPELHALKNWIDKYAPLKELGQINV
ncbi:aminoglycoside phosphotransferase family protein [Pseudaquidulcibacter saccharophilus]|uniref:aminoglycoside phosphotransferase family protein n=1 Tax=Pseudaquidulcibacter saccharophilus TaxID=2831900 RepID=UPI001EFF150A|nr:phosphotransferase [Pseudaquidulcibacter saccharophilus]